MSYLSKIPNSETFSLFYQKNSSNFYLYQNLKYGKVYYKNKVLCLVSGKTSASSIALLNRELEKEELELKSNYRVWHLFYEFGFSSVKLDDYVSDSSILAIQLCYKRKKKISLGKVKKVNSKLTLSTSIDEMAYKSKFIRGYKNLEVGNCYQFNLTEKLIYKYPKDDTAVELISRLFKDSRKLSAYAHATNLPLLAALYISNSPECLFSLRKLGYTNKNYWQLRTMPIKGTIRREKGDELSKLWRELKNSEKNENELLMITDLLRNDLSKIEEPRARVLAERLPLLVPGLLHQYSLIEVLLSKNVSLAQIIKALFPGGSITGAPKKRVMEILLDLEDRDRGFYCGSTLLLEEGRVSASINIRSAVLDLKRAFLELSAGGGVTLMSEATEEFNELKAKLESFISLWA
jgi:para-aminobenzoate synthetase component 1